MHCFKFLSRCTTTITAVSSKEQPTASWSLRTRLTLSTMLMKIANKKYNAFQRVDGKEKLWIYKNAINRFRPNSSEVNLSNINLLCLRFGRQISERIIIMANYWWSNWPVIAYVLMTNYFKLFISPQSLLTCQFHRYNKNFDIQAINNNYQLLKRWNHKAVHRRYHLSFKAVKLTF